MSGLAQRLAAARPRRRDETDTTAAGMIAGVWRVFADWRRRAQERAQLARMDERELRDIGLTWADAEREYVKPFWRG